MRPGHFARGLRIGLIVAAASAGVLIAFGMGAGRPFLPLNLAMRPWLPLRGDHADFHPLITLAGIVGLMLGSVIWSTLFSAAVSRLGPRGGRLLLLAAAFGALIFAVGHLILPRALRPGYDGVLSMPQLAALHLVVAAALAFGMRLALLPRD